jgi:hypothetical protein
MVDLVLSRLELPFLSDDFSLPLPLDLELLPLAAKIGRQYWKFARVKRGTTDSRSGRKTRWSCWVGMSRRW